MDTTRFNSWENQKDEFQGYVNKWEDALKKGIFNTPEKSSKEDTFFDIIKTEPTDKFNAPDVDYWNKIQDMNFNNTELKVYNEAKKSDSKKPNPKKTASKSKKEKSVSDFEPVKNSLEANKDINNIVKKATKLANNPNPVYHNSYGKDTTDESGKSRVTAGFSADDRLPALQDLYKALYQLEIKMSGKFGLDKKLTEKMQKQIKKVKALISKISDSMGGDFKSATDYN